MDSEFKSKVESIQNQISALQTELKVIRSICRHPKESEVVKDINPSGGSELRNICGHCGETRGYPTKEQVDKYLSYVR